MLIAAAMITDIKIVMAQLSAEWENGNATFMP